MPVAIAVKVRLFARLREQAGTEIETLEMAAGSTLADVYEALRSNHSALEPDRKAVRAALNQEFEDWSARVADGDEVAFIPPVSGGAHGVGILFELTPDPLDARRMEAAWLAKAVFEIVIVTSSPSRNGTESSSTRLFGPATPRMLAM